MPTTTTAPVPVLPVIDYARPTWDGIRRTARRAARRNGLGAAYLGFLLFLVCLLCGMALLRLRLPWWVLLCVLVVLTAAPAYLAALGAYRLTIERECARSGLCRRCGYDLRASDGRCPECGTRFRRRAG